MNRKKDWRRLSKEGCSLAQLAGRGGAVGECWWSCLPDDAGSRPLQRLWGADAGERLLLRGAGEELSRVLAIKQQGKQKEEQATLRAQCSRRASVVGTPFSVSRLHLGAESWLVTQWQGALEAQGMWQKGSGRGWEHVEGVSILAGRHKPARMTGSWKIDTLTSEVFTI